MDIRLLEDTIAAAPQISLGELKAVADAGYRSVISNRPDGEAPDQPSAAEMARAAQAVGLEFRHIPVVPGAISPGDVAAFKAALAEAPRPVLGFCRTGTRTASLWALANAGDRSAESLLEAARRVGYDLSGLKLRLQGEPS